MRVGDDDFTGVRVATLSATQLFVKSAPRAQAIEAKRIEEPAPPRLRCPISAEPSLKFGFGHVGCVARQVLGSAPPAQLCFEPIHQVVELAAVRVPMSMVAIFAIDAADLRLAPCRLLEVMCSACWAS